MKTNKRLKSLITEALSSSTLPDDIEAFLDQIAQRGHAIKGDVDAQMAILDELRPIKREFQRQMSDARDNGDNAKAEELSMLLDELTAVLSVDVFGYRRSTPEIWWAGAVQSRGEGT